LTAHYRSPLNFSVEVLESAQDALDAFYGALRPHTGIDSAELKTVETAVYDALLDDINTPEAIAALYAAAKTLNKASDAKAIAEAKAELLVGGALLGLLSEDPEAWFQRGVGQEGPTAEEIEALIQERLLARSSRDFDRADEIRQTLEEQGVLLDDGPDGTQWRRRG
jgi:cysteinyl-tRNA synthetase